MYFFPFLPFVQTRTVQNIFLSVCFYHLFQTFSAKLVKAAGKLADTKKKASFLIGEFVPDLITLYCRPAQLRSIIMAVRFETGEQLQVCLDSVDSCVHSSIPVLNGKDYNITIPDPGEYERALVDEDEMMFTLRPENLEAVIRNLEMLSKSGFGYKELAYGLEFDTPRPEFYNKMYQKWNLDTGKKWHKP